MKTKFERMQEKSLLCKSSTMSIDAKADKYESMTFYNDIVDDIESHCINCGKEKKTENMESYLIDVGIYISTALCKECAVISSRVHEFLEYNSDIQKDTEHVCMDCGYEYKESKMKIFNLGVIKQEDNFLCEGCVEHRRYTDTLALISSSIPDSCANCGSHDNMHSVGHDGLCVICHDYDEYITNINS